MSWLDRLLGRDPPDYKSEREKDREALADLHKSFDAVSLRSERLESELLRVNQALRDSRRAGR